MVRGAEGQPRCDDDRDLRRRSLGGAQRQLLDCEKVCSGGEVRTVLFGCAERQDDGGAGGNRAEFMARHFCKKQATWFHDSGLCVSRMLDRLREQTSELY